MTEAQFRARDKFSLWDLINQQEKELKLKDEIISELKKKLEIPEGEKQKCPECGSTNLIWDWPPNDDVPWWCDSCGYDFSKKE